MFKLNPKYSATISAEGEGIKLTSPSQEIIVKVSGKDSPLNSTFEVTVPPLFNVGAHYHLHTEELFYIIEGELLFLTFEPVNYSDKWFDWVGYNNERPKLCGKGTLIHVPNEVPHAFCNLTNKPAKMIFQASPPPDHEIYFEELTKIFNETTSPDKQKIQNLRDKYDVHQITPLYFMSKEEAEHEYEKRRK